CAIHQRRGAPPPPASSLMEQHLVSALLVRRHQLHAPLELRDLCSARLVHRRLCHYHLSPSRPDLSNSAARLLAGMIEKPPQPVVYDHASFHLTSLPPGARDDWPARRLPRPPCSQSTSPRKVCHARSGSQELPASVTFLAMTVGRPSADADEVYGQEQQPQVWCP